MESGFAKGVKLILKFGFEDLKLHRISATTLEDNLTSKRVLEKVGFKLEGKKRETRLKHGKWCTDLVYGILEAEYKSMGLKG